MKRLVVIVKATKGNDKDLLDNILNLKKGIILKYTNNKGFYYVVLNKIPCGKKLHCGVFALDGR